jgi:hypothetical protein
VVGEHRLRTEASADIGNLVRRKTTAGQQAPLAFCHSLRTDSHTEESMGRLKGLFGVKGKAVGSGKGAGETKAALRESRWGKATGKVCVGRLRLTSKVSTKVRQGGTPKLTSPA